MKTERKKLKVGSTYFIDQSKRVKGVFVQRKGDTIFFDCGEDHYYYHSIVPGKEHLVSFMSEGEGFEEVQQ